MGKGPDPHVEGRLAHAVAVTFPLFICAYGSRQIRNGTEPDSAILRHQAAKPGSHGQGGPGIGQQAVTQPLGIDLLYPLLRHEVDIVQQAYGVDHHARQRDCVIEGEQRIERERIHLLQRKVAGRI